MYFRFSDIKVKETKTIWPFEEGVSRAKNKWTRINDRKQKGY